MTTARPLRHGLGTGRRERFVFPLKPGNAGGGKEPQFETDAVRREGRDREVGKPDDSGKRSETPDGVARESKGSPGESVLQFIRANWLSNRAFSSYDDDRHHFCIGPKG
jgi:hypothetical protein